MSFYITQRGYKRINKVTQFIVAYTVIAITMYLIDGVGISGRDYTTKFYFDNYIGTEKLKIIASILWLPLIIVFLFRGGR